VLDLYFINTEEGLYDLKPTWNRLLEKSASDTVFLTWEWVLAWWRCYGEGKKLFIIKVLKNGEVIGLAPLYLATFQKFNSIRYRGLFLLGDGSSDSDYMDFIIKIGEEEEVIDLLVKFLFSKIRKWDVFVLNEVPKSSFNLKILMSRLNTSKLYVSKKRIGCVYVALEPDWEFYLSKLKPRMRTKIKSLTQKLETNHRVKFDMCKGVENLGIRLQSLFELHQMRWRLKGEKGVFQSIKKRKFYEEMGKAFLKNNWLRFYSLLVDDRYVAHQFCFEYNKQMFLLQEGFDTRWIEKGVGNVLRGYVFRDCINRGISVYDFLGGVSRHKLSWGGEVKESESVHFGDRNFKNWFYFGMPERIDWIMGTMKTRLPERAVEALKNDRFMRVRRFFIRGGVKIY
jgi:CelD/BcsL family acetyltransferase involved in cellulose biosynthesis